MRERPSGGLVSEFRIKDGVLGNETFFCCAQIITFPQVALLARLGGRACPVRFPDHRIRQAGLDNPAGSGGPDKWSSYLITGEDGHDAYLASNYDYRNWIHLGDNRCILGVYSKYYKAGVTVAGIGVFTETTYNTVTSQCIKAGYKTWRLHWEWGRGGQYTDRLARVLYSY